MLNKLGALLAEVPDISEDCLYLNIYTPAKRANNAKLPVRIFCRRFWLLPNHSLNKDTIL